ncbi:MAG: putative Ig domain-containing protein [Myxococcales bacterium]|nr:putative Ig domain-containing protein [Myxococcales bacterium]
MAVRLKGWPWVAVLVLGCNILPKRGDAPVIPPEQQYLEAPDQVLPSATVGTPYGATLEVDGGDAPYTWRLKDVRGLPEGLDLREDGVLQGTPVHAGTFEFAVIASDASGRTKRTVISLTVVLDPQVLRCGDIAEGRFDRSVMTASGPDLSDLDNVAWLAVELPEDQTERIDLVFHNDAAAVLYVELPAEPLGSWEIDTDYVTRSLNPALAPVIPLDASTTPSLTGYLTQPTVPLLLAPQAAGRWKVEVVCSDGPIFKQLPQYPTELGQPLQIDYEVYGDNDNVRIWTEDPLPEWMDWDESTGIVSGIAEEPGAWEFTIIAERPDGRRREERSIIGVYEVTEIGCGATQPIHVTENYFEGEFIGYYDPRAYNVFHLPLDRTDISGIRLRVSGSDGHYLGLADPDPDWLKFYGGAQRIYVDMLDAVLDLGPETYPATRHYEAAKEMYFSAGSVGDDLEGLRMTVTCDTTPLPDMAALPVIQPLIEVEHPLQAIGGSPPYSWTAEGLPPGLSMRSDGAIVGATGATGTHSVKLHVEDRYRQSGDATYPLFVGTTAACGRAIPLACNESVDGHFTHNYAQDGNGDGSTEIFCIVDDREHTYGVEVYSDDGELRVDVADPGVTRGEMFDPGNATYVSYVGKDALEAVPLDPFSWPDLDDYAGQRIFVSVRAFDPGSWTVHLDCSPALTGR